MEDFETKHSKMGSRWVQDAEASSHQQLGLIGYPVAHSLSPVMHNAAFEAIGLDWSYDLFECEDETQAQEQIARVADGSYLGLNVTMPYKKFAADACDELVQNAYVTQVANVLVKEDDKLVGYNTDGDGIVGAFLQKKLIVCGSSFLVCGTGAASKAAVEALARSGARRVVVMSRSLESAQNLVEGLTAVRLPKTAELVCASYDEALEHMAQVDGIVDGTSLGMKEGDPSVLPAEGFNSHQVVLDVVYGHGKTALVAAAEAAGATVMDGLEMLIEQAVGTLYIWMRIQGVRTKVNVRAVMREAAYAEVARRQGARDDAAAQGE